MSAKCSRCGKAIHDFEEWYVGTCLVPTSIIAGHILTSAEWMALPYKEKGTAGR